MRHVNPLIYQEILMDAQVKGSNVAKANPSAATVGADTEKAKALQAALAQIEKQFGKGYRPWGRGFAAWPRG